MEEPLRSSHKSITISRGSDDPRLLIGEPRRGSHTKPGASHQLQAWPISATFFLKTALADEHALAVQFHEDLSTERERGKAAGRGELIDEGGKLRRTDFDDAVR